MTEDKEEKQKHQEHGGKHFDMYHFFSRKDVIFIGLMVILLLIYVLYLNLSENVTA